MPDLPYGGAIRLAIAIAITQPLISRSDCWNPLLWDPLTGALIMGNPKTYSHPRLQVFPRWEENPGKRGETKSSQAEQELEGGDQALAAGLILNRH